MRQRLASGKSLDQKAGRTAKRTRSLPCAAHQILPARGRGTAGPALALYSHTHSHTRFTHSLPISFLSPVCFFLSPTHRPSQTVLTARRLFFRSFLSDSLTGWKSGMLVCFRFCMCSLSLYIQRKDSLFRSVYPPSPSRRRADRHSRRKPNGLGDLIGYFGLVSRSRRPGALHVKFTKKTGGTRSPNFSL